jgi:plastocyanin
VDDIPANTSGTFTRTFTTAGTFAFHCSFHAGMTGQVVVQ